MPEDATPNQVTQPGVPFWALNLVSDVAAIKQSSKEAAASIATIEKELAALRDASVPMDEHQRLRTRVGDMWDLSTRTIPQWEERRPRIDTLWTERSELFGSIRTIIWALRGLGLFQAGILVVFGAYQAGLRIHFG